MPASSAVPGYWTAAADYLARTDDGSVALEVPAAAFGVYDWGNVHDDVLQGLADSPWAVRNVIPLAQPGNVVFLDAVTRAVESGHPSSTLAPFLAANGVGRLVVRNDLDRFQTGAPDPAYVSSVLDPLAGASPWPARSARPSGSPPVSYGPDGTTRVVAGTGLATRTGSVDVYDVSAPAGARLTADPEVARGRPRRGAAPSLGGPAARLLPEDARRAPRVARPGRCSPTACGGGRPTSRRSAGTSRRRCPPARRTASSAPSTPTASSRTRSAGRPPRCGRARSPT